MCYDADIGSQRRRFQYISNSNGRRKVVQPLAIKRSLFVCLFRMITNNVFFSKGIDPFDDIIQKQKNFNSPSLCPGSFRKF